MRWLILFVFSLSLSLAQPLSAVTWPLKDPGTGKPISPNTLLTLPDGRQIKAGEFYGELNQHEKHLNAFDVSLQDNRTDFGTVKTEPSKKSLLAAQKINLEKGNASALIPFNLTLAAPLKATSAEPPPCTVEDIQSYYKTWSNEIGSDRFAVGLNTELALNSSCKFSRAVSRSSFSARAFFLTYDLITLKVYAQTKDDNYNYGYQVLVGGYNVGNEQGGSTSPADYTRNINRDFAAKGDFTYPVGPFTVKVSFGIHGEVGLKFATGSRNLMAYGNIGPYGKLSVFLEGGVGVVIAEIGIGGEFLLLDTQVTANGSVEIAPQNGVLKIHSRLYGRYDWRALDGRLYVFARVYVPSWSWPPYKKKTYTEDVAKWDGFHSGGDFLNHELWETLLEGEGT